jgi:hypothetical protein
VEEVLLDGLAAVGDLIEEARRHLEHDPVTIKAVLLAVVGRVIVTDLLMAVLPTPDPLGRPEPARAPP